MVQARQTDVVAPLPKNKVPAVKAAVPAAQTNPAPGVQTKQGPAVKAAGPSPGVKIDVRSEAGNVLMLY